MKTGILDDHPLFAEGIAGILRNYDWMEVVFTGQRSEQLLQWLEEHRLELLLLDISLSNENGLEVLSLLKQKYPTLKVIILTTHQPADISLTLDSFPGDAYVLKISGRKILEEAFEKVLAGEQFFDPNLIVYQPPKSSNPYRLTKREMEIIALITSGKTTKEIAAQLFLSEMTIKTHRRNISEKLGSRNVADLFYKINKLNGSDS